MSKFIAIDLDAQGLFVVAGSARSGQAKVEQAVAWSGTEAEGGPPTLTLQTATAIGEQLRERLRSAGISAAPTIITIARDRVVLKELRYPDVPVSEEPNIVRFQALKELSDSPDEVVLDYVPMSAAAGERKSMAVAVRKELYQALQQMCVAANLRLVGVTARPYAIAAGVKQALSTGATPAPESPLDAIAVLTLSPGGGEFTVTCNGEVTFTRAVPAPVVASDSMLLAEVRRNLTMYAGANPGHPVQALYVAESSGRWALKLGSALGIPVHAYDPLLGSTTNVEDSARGRYAAAAGLLAARSGGDLPINFVNPRQPIAQVNPNRTLALVGLLAGLLLFAVGGAWGYLSLKAADDDLVLKTKLRNDAKKLWEATKPDADRLAAAETWKSRRVIWLDELFDMADRKPVAPGFHVVSFNGKAKTPNAKTGKQDSQAELQIKVTARTPEPVNAFVAAIDRDSIDPNPKDPKNPKKYYIGADKSIGGPSADEPSAQEYTIKVLGVNQRPADRFTRMPTFSPPQRKYYPPTPPSAKEPAKETEKAARASG